MPVICQSLTEPLGRCSLCPVQFCSTIGGKIPFPIKVSVPKCIFSFRLSRKKSGVLGEISGKFFPRRVLDFAPGNGMLANTLRDILGFWDVSAGPGIDSCGSLPVQDIL